MRVASLPAAAGWRWVARGFGLLRRQPIALLAITFLNLLLLSLSVLVPFVGSIAPLVLAPALLVGLMRAVRTADEGRMPLPSMLFAAFREDGGRAIRPLLLLGIVNALATMLALALAALFDDGALMQLAIGSLEQAESIEIDESSLWLAAAMFVAAYVPVQMAMWYAPLFVAWHRTPPVKALFFSLFAVWRNRRAFVVYADRLVRDRLRRIARRALRAGRLRLASVRDVDDPLAALAGADHRDLLLVLADLSRGGERPGERNARQRGARRAGMTIT